MDRPSLPSQLQVILDTVLETQSAATERVLLAEEARARSEHTVEQLRRNRALADQLLQEIRATLHQRRM